MIEIKAFMVLFAVSMSLASIAVLYFALSDAADKEADVMVRLPIDNRTNEQCVLDALAAVQAIPDSKLPKHEKDKLAQTVKQYVKEGFRE